MKKIAFIIIIFLISGSIIFFDKIRQNAIAVTQGDYNRAAPGGGILFDDWNVLDEDFLLSDGSSQMDADLNIEGNQAVNLGESLNQSDVATVNYVNSQIESNLVGIQGGDIYVNWGRDDCGGGDVALYSGYGFGNLFSSISGGENEICISEPFDGGLLNSGSMSDSLYPLMTGEHVYFPDDGTTYQEITLIKCAVCYKEVSSCYLNIGTHQCSVTDFVNKAYDGYMVGEISEIASYKSTSQSSCLNLNFDSSGGGALLGGSIWRGAAIGNNFGLNAYDEDQFIKCAVSCK